MGEIGAVRRGPFLRSRWIAAAFAGAAVVLLPWMVLLAVGLPDHLRVRNWATAWIGLDVLLLAAIVLTAWLAYRRDLRYGLTAAATAAICVVDSWFDVTTSAGRGWWIALALAVLVELPFAVACGWLALRAYRLAVTRAAASRPPGPS
ncbi:MAG: hypothetical protein J2P24_01190 [Streptosporangiales bacterium]|nr:hypothetical protein [Streptosporangiales bacterium]MBO0892652.1 hypothetical protein [Acidothermales bacterium]